MVIKYIIKAILLNKLRIKLQSKYNAKYIKYMKPEISIIIPMYNVEKYIFKCIESCVNQTFNNIEILIIDDYSNDNSIKIVQEFAKKDSRIKIIENNKNLGTFNTRIKGIQNANGNYLLFLDADDSIDITTCEKLNNITNKYKNLYEAPDIIFFGMKFYPPTFKKISPPIITKELHKEEILQATFAHCATPPWHIWAKLYKASHMMKTANFILAHMGEKDRLNMAEDVLKSFITIAIANKSIGIKDKLYIYHINSDSITNRIDTRSIEKKISDINKIIYYINLFCETNELKNNPYSKLTANKIENILRSVVILESRYTESKNTILPIYLQSTIHSLYYYRKWQTYVRIILYIITLGKVKL